MLDIKGGKRAKNGLVVPPYRKPFFLHKMRHLYQPDRFEEDPEKRAISGFYPLR